MLKQADVSEILRVEALRLPKRPRVVDLHVEPYTAWDGEEALQLWVILDNATQGADRRWAKLEPIEREIRDVLRRAGVRLWPYITCRTRSEFAAERRRRK
jgi:hypothetical protein